MKTQNRIRPLAWLITLVATALVAGAAPMAQRETAVVLPEGTTVAVRTIDRITSAGSASQMEYRASVDDSIAFDGVTRVPVGAPAFLRVIDLQQAGSVSGRAALTLRLVAVEVDGQRVEFDSGDARIESSSQTAKAAKSGAAGAVAGSLLGALLGGKEGALEGAAIGGAAGVVAAAASGQRVQIPAETRLSFGLTRNGVAALRSSIADAEMLAGFVALKKEAEEAGRLGDRAAVDAMLAPGFSATYDGQAFTRAKFLSRIKRQPNIVSIDIESPDLRLDEHDAALTGYVVYQVRRGKDVRSVRQKFREDFTEAGGQWLFRASESVSQ